MQSHAYPLCQTGVLDLLSLCAQRGNLVDVAMEFQHRLDTAGTRLPRMPDGILEMTD